MSERPPFLRDLSSDHHQGLVLARHARQAALQDASEQAQMWQEVCQSFARELEPHFQAEELHLFPALRTAGEDVLVEQALREHVVLRALVAEPATPSLQAFADLLVAHIRFEEREMFARAIQLYEQGLLNFS
jgi:hemerythrin-like domain-containing protein